MHTFQSAGQARPAKIEWFGGQAPRTWAPAVGRWARRFGVIVSVGLAPMAWAGEPSAAQSPTPSATAPASVPAPREAVLGPGDLVQIVVYQNPDLSLESRLDERGDIRYPLLGRVALGGETLGGAEQRIARLLQDGGFVRQPQVSLRWVQALSRQVSVLGQVGRPGRYALESASVRLPDVVALAGGVLPGGADTVTVVGTRAGQPVRWEFDLMGCLQGASGRRPCAAGATAAEPRVEAGDTLFVERAPVFYIYGEVQRPGVFRLERGMTVLQALAQAGGLTPRGTERGLRVHRQVADANPQTLEATLTDAVQRDDVIYIRESIF